MKTIKYIGFYPKDKDRFIRIGSIAAGNKVDYICSAVNDVGYKVEIISPAWFDNQRKHSKQCSIKENKMRSVLD